MKNKYFIFYSWPFVLCKFACTLVNYPPRTPQHLRSCTQQAALYRLGASRRSQFDHKIVPGDLPISFHNNSLWVLRKGSYRSLDSRGSGRSLKNSLSSVATSWGQWSAVSCTSPNRSNSSRSWGRGAVGVTSWLKKGLVKRYQYARPWFKKRLPLFKTTE